MRKRIRRSKTKPKKKNVPSKKETFEKIRKSQERLIVSLASAWESAPDDPEIRAQLMSATEKAVQLRERLYKEILKEDPPDVKQSYEKLKGKLEEEIKLRD